VLTESVLRSPALAADSSTPKFRGSFPISAPFFVYRLPSAWRFLIVLRIGLPEAKVFAQERVLTQGIGRFCNFFSLFPFCFM